VTGKPHSRAHLAARRRAIADEHRRVPRVLGAVLVLASITVAGGLWLYVLGDGRWRLWDALYMALNAVSTAGFREIEGMEQVAFARAATFVTIVAGLGAVAYFQSSLTALLVEGVIGKRLRSTRMQKRIDHLGDHVIVCGVGTTGVHVVEELHLTRVPFVAIDRDRHLLERVARDVTRGDLLYVVGDATEDAVLVEAGITRCRGVVAALTEDRDNLYVTLSARSLNAGARIVTKVIAADAAPKMVRAGANATVSPNMIGGRQLASEIARPVVVEFIDQMLRQKDQILRLEEVVIPDGSFFVGRTLLEVPIRSETKLLVVALRVERQFLYNPEPSTTLEAGSILVVLGESKNVERLRGLVKMHHPPRADA
jgi:voltage-gated potassium channel